MTGNALKIGKLVNITILTSVSICFVKIYLKLLVIMNRKWPETLLKRLNQYLEKTKKDNLAAQNEF